MRIPFALAAMFLLFSMTGCKKETGPKPPTVAEMIEMLNSGDVDAQVNAAQWASSMGPKAMEAKPALLALVKHDNPSVRQGAIAALGKLGPEAAADVVPALTEALKDRELRVQLAAVNALADFGPAASSAIPALEALSRGTDGCKAPSQAALNKIRS